MSGKIGPIGLVVIQGNSLCNLNCSYCYLSEEKRSQSQLFSLELLELAFKKIFTSPYIGEKGLLVLWHAGEPLVLPIEYYEQSIRLITALKNKFAPDIQIDFSMQTNGTLITQEWCDFFIKYNVYVGISCDGPEEIHDRQRLDWRKTGTLAKTVQGFQLLKANGIEFGALATITPLTIQQPEKFIDFFRKHNIPVGMNIVSNNETHTRFDEGLDALEAEFRHFISALLQELDSHTESDIFVREFKNLYTRLLGIRLPSKLDSNGSNVPYAIINMDANGNFSTYAPELLTMKSELYGDFVLGNFYKDTLESATQSEKFKRLYRDIETGRKLCEDTCEYYSVCGSGYASSKHGTFGKFDVTETLDCRFRIKIMTDVLMDYLETVIDNHDRLEASEKRIMPELDKIYSLI